MEFSVHRPSPSNTYSYVREENLGSTKKNCRKSLIFYVYYQRNSLNMYHTCAEHWGAGETFLRQWKISSSSPRVVSVIWVRKRGSLYGTYLISVNSFCDVIFSLMRKLCYRQYINYKKTRTARWHGGGVVVLILCPMVQFEFKFFIFRLVECTNSFNIRLHL